MSTFLLILKLHVLRQDLKTLFIKFLFTAVPILRVTVKPTLQKERLFLETFKIRNFPYNAMPFFLVIRKSSLFFIEVSLESCRKLLSSFLPSSDKNFFATWCWHSWSESMSFFSYFITWLKGSFHNFSLAFYIKSKIFVNWNLIAKNSSISSFINSSQQSVFLLLNNC